MPPSLDDALPLSRGPAMANRFMLAPLTNTQSHADGTLSEAEHHWLMMRAQGGFGLTMTCAAHVQRNGQGFPGQLGIWDDAHLPGLTRLAKGIRDTGSIAAVQLQHSGRRAMADLTGEPASCPWDDAKSGAKSMTSEAIEQLIADFVRAAVRAEEAGFHGVELHGAHGYLLGQFLDADNNCRADGYGGDAAGRERVLRAVIDGIRAATEPDFQLGVRLSPERFGISIDDARELAQSLMTGGQIDYLDMSLWDAFKQPMDDAHKGKPLIAHFTDLERGDCRLGVAGKIMSAATAQRCIDMGSDYVLIGRGAIVHHDFPRLAIANAAFDVKPRPLARDYLRREGVSDVFLDYIKQNWPDFIID